MKTIGHTIFLVAFFTYLMYYVLKHLGTEMPVLITSYLADLLSLFLINTLVLFVLRKIYSRPNLELSVGMIIISFVLITVLFEVIQPMKDNYFVADPIDILCYLISASIYYLWRKVGA
jgi:branched-subunit amino acid ABC-type transport system permease component